MAVIEIVGVEEKGGIPSNSNIRLESLPDRNVVYKGEVSQSLTLNLDPGKYVYSIYKHLGKKRMFKYVAKFLHKITEEQYQKLKDITPRNMRPVQTSKGQMWRCKISPTCDVSVGTRMSAIMHEAEHMGIDVLTGGDKEQLAYETHSENTARQIKKRGRPKKNTEEIADVV